MTKYGRLWVRAACVGSADGKGTRRGAVGSRKGMKEEA